jgi:hypothetical protein
MGHWGVVRTLLQATLHSVLSEQPRCEDAAPKLHRLGRMAVKIFSRPGINQLPFDNAIKIVKGNGQRKLALFGDPVSADGRRMTGAM